MSGVPRKELSLFDTTCIIVGIIIGAGIYETAPLVAGCMGGWFGILGIWLAGGVLALCGAICYAELATMYPRQGGDCVYLSKAYGRWAGYMFGWTQITIIRPADIALMAFIFGRYAQTLYSPCNGMATVYAVAAVVILTFINVLSVRKGKWTQNLLAVIKVCGLLLIVMSAFAAHDTITATVQQPLSLDGVQLALILVLFTFGGWNEMAYIAAEVKKPETNIVRSLIIGTLMVTVIYLLVNSAFLLSLGYDRMVASKAVAVDVVEKVFPQFAGRIISVLVCLSALGAVNGLIFTGSRITYAMGEEYRLFHKLGKWNERYGTPVWSLVMQGCLSIVIIVAAGTFVEAILCTAPIVWLFFLATGVSVIVLRFRQPGMERSYKITGYPMPAIVFIICCAFMLYSSATYAVANRPLFLCILLGVMLAGALSCRAGMGDGK